MTSKNKSRSGMPRCYGNRRSTGGTGIPPKSMEVLAHEAGASERQLIRGLRIRRGQKHANVVKMLVLFRCIDLLKHCSRGRKILPHVLFSEGELQRCWRTVAGAHEILGSVIATLEPKYVQRRSRMQRRAVFCVCVRVLAGIEGMRWAKRTDPEFGWSPVFLAESSNEGLTCACRSFLEFLRSSGRARKGVRARRLGRSP